MRVLVIGGTGMIGTAVTQQLLARGDDVTLFTRGQTEMRLEVGGNSPTFITGDRREHAAFEALVRDAGTFDALVDMVGFREEDAASVLRACVGLTRRIVFCSTASVYGWPAQRYPVTEDEPLRSSEAYGVNKAACEALLLAAHARGEASVTILRLAHTYGEGRAMLHPLGNRSTFIDRLRKGKPVVVHGDGSSLWAACHVEDVARAFVAACDTDAAAGRAYNVAGDEWLTWNRYVQLVAEAAGAPSPQIVHILTDVLARAVPEAARRARDSYQYPKVFDTSAARTALGFEQRVSFVEGTRRVIAWLDARGAIEPYDAEPWYDRLVDGWQRLAGSLEAELQ